MCLVVLFLLAHKQHPYLGIVDHELYLLLTAGGIERNNDRTHAKSTEVGIEIWKSILRKHTNIFLYPDTYVEQGVGYTAHLGRKLIP